MLAWKQLHAEGNEDEDLHRGIMRYDDGIAYRPLSTQRQHKYSYSSSILHNLLVQTSREKKEPRTNHLPCVMASGIGAITAASSWRCRSPAYCSSMTTASEQGLDAGALPQALARGMGGWFGTATFAMLINYYKGSFLLR